MGNIADAFSSVYRDYVVPGAPGSGENFPVKSDIRGIGATIEQVLTTAGIADDIYETTAAGITGTTSGQLFLVKGDGATSFADLYKNNAGTAVAQNMSIPSVAYIVSSQATQDALSLRLSSALFERSRISPELISTAQASPDLTTSLVLYPGNIQSAYFADGTYWETPEFAVNLGKYRNLVGESTFSGFNYLAYDVTGDELEIRATGRAGTSTVPLIVFADSGGTAISAYVADLPDVKSFFDVPLALPVGTEKIYVNSLAYSALSLTVRNESDAILERINSDAYGSGVQPYVARIGTNRPLVLDSSDTIRVNFSHGQSWRSDVIPVPFALLLERMGDGRAMTFRESENGSALPPIGIDFFATIADDFFNLNFDMTANNDPANAGGNIGWVAAQSLASFGDRFRVHQRPILDVCGAYPGQPIGPLLPGGSVTVGAETYHPWATMLAYLGAARTIAETLYNKKCHVESFAWTQGDSTGYADYYDGLTAVLDALDAADVNDDGLPIPFFMDQKAMTNVDLVADQVVTRQLDFANDNPGRVFLYGPRYPYPMRDEIHHTGLGYVMVGELEGYVRHLVLDRATEFALFPAPYVWEPARITNISIVGTAFTATISAPLGFGDLAIDTDTIEAAPQMGFHVRRVSTGIDIALSGIAINGNTVTGTLASGLVAAADYEVSYAYRGPGASVGTHSGVWGNVKRTGPKSNWIDGGTVDAWVCAHKQTITG